MTCTGRSVFEFQRRVTSTLFTWYVGGYSFRSIDEKPWKTTCDGLNCTVILWGASWSVLWAMLSTFTSTTGSISEGCAIMSIAFLDISHLYTNLGPGLPYLWKYYHEFNCFVLGVLLKIFIIGAVFRFGWIYSQKF